MIIFIIAFVAGVFTVLAPCVLPLLPIIVGGSVTGELSRKKAIVVTISLGVSVIVFTFLLKISTLFIDIPPQIWSWISGGIIIILGLVTLFPDAWDKFTTSFSLAGKANRESNKLMAVGYKKNSIWGDIIIGASLGPVFSTCSPTYFFILATVLPLSPVVGFIDLLAYVVGLCLVLLVVAFIGQKIVEKLGNASDPKGWIKRTLGVIFVLVGIAIFLGVDKTIEAQILTSGFFDITQVEQVFLKNISGNSPLKLAPDTTSATPDISTTISPSTPTISTTKQNSKYIPTAKEREMMKAQLYPKAPEIVNPSGFVNTDGKPITIGQFKGKKVVLLDVWTYSCINCQRTLPYVKAWYDKYHDQGLEIIGLHTPEFSFEKVQKNVDDAVKRDGIQYPVVLDNDYATWNAYGNNVWPRKYLIDTDGFIIYDHSGEGDYDVTEKAIQKALADRATILDASTTITTTIAQPKDVITLDPSKVGSPETYFGAERNEYLANGQQSTAGLQNLTLPDPNKIDANALYLGGLWNFEKEYAQTKIAETTVLFKYNSKNIYMVASADMPTDVEIWIDGVKKNTVSIKDEMLYTLVEGKDYGVHTLMLKIHNPGLKAFTFTFG